jgi:hypothetical protein
MCCILQEQNCLLHQLRSFIYDMFQACSQDIFYKASACDSYVFISSILCNSVYSSGGPFLSVSMLELVTRTDEGRNMQYMGGNEHR